MLHSRTRALALAVALVVVAPSAAAAQEIEGQYIVVFKNSASAGRGRGAKRKVRARGGKVAARVHARARTASRQADAKALAEVRGDAARRLRRARPRDHARRHAADTRDVGPRPHRPARAAAEQHATPTTPTGAGVTAYIIDTGIRITHTQFGGRAGRRLRRRRRRQPADDCNGHGTHVAGTVGGSTYGVAKGVTLVAVRVLNCSGSGTTSGVIAGIDWVTDQPRQPARRRQHEPRRRRLHRARHGGRPTRSPPA